RPGRTPAAAAASCRPASCAGASALPPSAPARAPRPACSQGRTWRSLRARAGTDACRDDVPRATGTRGSLSRLAIGSASEKSREPRALGVVPGEHRAELGASGHAREYHARMLRSRVLLATCLLAACPAGTPRPVPPPRADDAALRIRIAQAEARRAGGVGELVDLAAHGARPERLLALRGLGRIGATGGPPVIASLVAALGDGDRDVVGAAAAAIRL